MTGRKNHALQVPPHCPIQSPGKSPKALHGTMRGTCSARFFCPDDERLAKFEIIDEWSKNTKFEINILILPFPPILTHHWKLCSKYLLTWNKMAFCNYYWISHEMKNFCRRDRFIKFAFLSNTFKTPNLIIFTPQQIITEKCWIMYNFCLQSSCITG